MNGQTTHTTSLASAGKDPGRFTVSVERTINLGNYESMHVGLAESFDTSADHDQAYRSVLAQLDSWTSAMKPRTQENGHEAPRHPASKMVILQERLGVRLEDVQVTEEASPPRR
jgi:hypothetical protein